MIEQIQARQAAQREERQKALKEGLNPFRPNGSHGPRVFADQGIVTVAWDDPHQIQLEFDLLSTDRRSGETSGELTIYTTGLADTRLLHRTRINLLSTMSQERLAKYLTARTKHLGLPWDELLAEACQNVLSLYRAGEPAILLRDAPDVPGAGVQLVPPVLVEDGATFLFGDGGVGKSQLALALAASLHTGRPLVADLEPSTCKRVAFLDWEWTAPVHRRRLARLWPLEEELPDLVYVPMRLPLREEHDRLRRIVRDQGIEYLVLDSVALAAGGEPESAEVAISFFAALRAIGLPSLCVAHVTNAAAKTSADRPFGSAFWHNSARATWYVKRGDASSAGRLLVGLYNRKANDAPLAPPMGLAISSEDDQTTISRADVRDEPDLNAERPMRLRLADELRTGPALVPDLAAALDADADTVRRTLNRGKARQFVQLVRPDGLTQWGLRHDE